MYGRVVGVGHETHALQRGDATIDRVEGQFAHLARAVAEPHRLLLTGEHLETARGVDARHDHVDGVRADVDRGAHVAAGAVGSGAAADGHAPIMPAIPSTDVSRWG